jgi:hypothetical protein
MIIRTIIVLVLASLLSNGCTPFSLSDLEKINLGDRSLSLIAEKTIDLLYKTTKTFPGFLEMKEIPKRGEESREKYYNNFTSLQKKFFVMVIYSHLNEKPTRDVKLIEIRFIGDKAQIYY